MDRNHSKNRHPQDDTELLVIIAGVGAVGTTLAAGVSLYRQRNIAPASCWSLTARDAVAANSESRSVADALSLPSLSAIRFAGFDREATTAWTLAERAGVLSPKDLNEAREDLESLRTHVGVTDASIEQRGAVSSITETRAAIREMMNVADARRAVLLLALSTENRSADEDAYASLASMEQAIEQGELLPTPSVVYAIAALREGVPVANLTPNRALDLPAIQQLAETRNLPITGSDLKTGQTLMKTVLAPALLDRGLQIDGWFGTNILGNGDGKALTQENALKAKLRSKSDPLHQILAERGANTDIQDLVRIHYYGPRGDNKESWDCIDFRGWLDYPMSLRVNFHCRDSILAAPLALDIALLLDASRRAGASGPQAWMGCFFKAPVYDPGQQPLSPSFPTQMRVLAEQAHSLHPASDYREDHRATQLPLVFRRVFRDLKEKTVAEPPRSDADERALTAWMSERIANALGKEIPVVTDLASLPSGHVSSGQAPGGHFVFANALLRENGRSLSTASTTFALIEGQELNIASVQAAFVGALHDGAFVSAVRGDALTLSPAATIRDGSTKTIGCDFDGKGDWSSETLAALGPVLSRYPLMEASHNPALGLSRIAAGELDAFVSLRASRTPDFFLAAAMLVQAAGGNVSIRGIDARAPLDPQNVYQVCATRNADDLAKLEQLLGF